MTIRKSGALTITIILSSFFGLSACEPMTDEQIAVSRQLALQQAEQQRQEAIKRAQYCKTDVYCPETQDSIAANCTELAKREKSWRRNDTYGNVFFSEIKYVGGYLFDFAPQHVSRYGDNHVVRFVIGVDSNSSSKPNRADHQRYHAHCIVDKQSLRIINIDYEPII